ncbi:putative protein-lysine N-methyltransferase Efm5/EEF1AKMT1 [Helianthus anomalus]
MEGEINYKTTVCVDDVDTPALGAHALEDLKEFLSERNRSLATYDGAMATEEKEVALVTEDWRLSQFWYDCETAETVAREVHALYMWWWWLKVTMVG